jgi:hypothetical protein
MSSDDEELLASSSCSSNQDEDGDGDEDELIYEQDDVNYEYENADDEREWKRKEKRRRRRRETELGSKFTLRKLAYYSVLVFTGIFSGALMVYSMLELSEKQHTALDGMFFSFNFPNFF